MHILIKYTLIFGYIANYLSTIDGIYLHFPQKNKNLFQTFNIPYSSASIYCSVIPYVTGAPCKLVILVINILRVNISVFLPFLYKLISFGISLDLQDNMDN